MSLNRGIRAVLSACVLLASVWALAQSADRTEMDHSKMDHSQMDHSQMSEAETDGHQGHGSADHGDHNPKFGGLVLMYGLLHFEIVARPNGEVELHLSDAMRTPMPAVSVSDVTVEVERDGGAFEMVPMAISDAGDFWWGTSGPLEDQENTKLHLAFVAYGQPYVYAMPLKVLQTETSDPPASGDSVVADAVGIDAG